MADDYTSAGLLAFLKQAAMAGIMNPATARGRRTAAEQLLSHLTAVEANDLRQVDVVELCARIHKLQDSTIRPEALDVYRARLEAAIGDYLHYLEDPDGFRASGVDTRTLRKRGSRPVSDHEQALEEVGLKTLEHPPDLMTVPLRKDAVVYIQNLPLDMTRDEARKVAGVIMAMASDGEDPVT